MRIKKAAEFEPKKELVEYLENRELALLAQKRGLNSKAKLIQFIEPEKYTPLELRDFPQIMEIVDFILEHIKKDSRILIYGDYDVDGISSTSILVGALSRLSDQISYHIPDRFKEGYGLNQEVLASYQEEIDLVISCDCGISNYDEVKFAKEAGMDFVVTDHHDLPDQLPPADYVISPRLLPEDHQGYWLPGAGMAYFLIKAVFSKAGKKGEEREFLDLLLLAIIADVVPLKGENRYLFKTGLKELQNTKRIGLKALYNELDINPLEINEKTLGFQIGPLLNSAGRIDSAEKGLKLLLAENKSKAAGLAAELNQINQHRKEISQRIYLELEKEMDPEQRKAVVSYDSDWHQGVIGIAAGRITENYQVPAVLMTSNQQSELITGSARSVEGININNLIAECSDLLEKHGGHAAAAGFSLKKDRLEKFKLRLQRLIDQELDEIDSELEIEADLNLELAELTEKFYQGLRLFAPFGEANLEPLFYLEGDILSSREISAGRHKRLVLGSENNKITALWWWAGEIENNYRQQFACRLTENIYQGNRSLQLEIKALAPLKEKSRKVKSQPDIKKQLKVIDWRQKDISELEAGAADTVYFAEGLKEYDLYPLINRNYYREAENLVLLTIPPSLAHLKEILLLTAAKKLFLINNEEQSLNINTFINKLLSLIKYSLQQENGIFKLEEAALALGAEEITVKRALEFLRAEAMLSYEYISYQELLITKGGTKDRGRSNLSSGSLKKLLKESSAFRRFIKYKDIDKIEGLLNNALSRNE
ncbi:MAG: single-stranded-DNA-specific exonuclease [Halanaerobium sp.]|jgi:single-stranded-DNA-specific exonuclease|uniref:Single-stranded-DNA-specific exonuclease RecJ n=1 Tax=Halanaerobium saccharolyticum TaxID=43595 RepID=A0A4R6SPK1_9FIRM|nr:single-stranded-DNA-specific exonuclease RecJ [Halanaerobium saccharolyticum]PUU93748.1 MAG: single-stranded-DNA-specific exonuclease [Halanaerobium sp.]TDQ06089.1 RecJ-like putative exonuclease [Halanaerobium saccharolyticum]